MYAGHRGARLLVLVFSLLLYIVKVRTISVRGNKIKSYSPGFAVIFAKWSPFFWLFPDLEDFPLNFPWHFGIIFKFSNFSLKFQSFVQFSPNCGKADILSFDNFLIIGATRFQDRTVFCAVCNYRCKCGNCDTMVTETECICCTEYEKILEKLEGRKCITQHPGFEAVCLNVWALETAWYGYNTDYMNTSHASLHR